MEWIEQIADSFVWFIPVAAVVGLFAIRWLHHHSRSWAERLFFAALLIVAGGTLRTIVVDDPGWLLHTFSLGLMVIGAAMPHGNSDRVEHFEF